MNNTNRNRIADNLFKAFGLFCTLFGLIILGILFVDIVWEGASRINWQFLTSLPSRMPAKAGILPAIAGTAMVMFHMVLFAVPVGIAAGLYLEEYGKNNRFARILEINITNLAGVPSIIYGLLGLEIFSRVMSLGGSILAGSLTLALLILPVIIVVTRESVRAVPKSIRDASYALGGTRWQTIWMQVLPAASGGILTGVILAISRAVGEAAPLIVIGALAYVPFIPTGPGDEFTVLPIQIFNWVSRPQKGFITNSAAAILVLLIMTFLLNALAIYLRNKWQKKINW